MCFLNLFECNVLQLYVHIGKFLLFINLVTCRYDLSGVIFSIFLGGCLFVLFSLLLFLVIIIYFKMWRLQNKSD